MKKHILIPLAVILLSVAACVKPENGEIDNPQPPTPQEQLTIPSTVDVNPVIAPEGGDTKITFTAAAAWTASVISTKADSWVDVNPKSGNAGPAEIKITTAPNDTYVERNATIQIKCGTQTKDIVLTQKQLDNITVTTDKVELGVEGGTFTVELKTNIDFSYEIEGDWIKYVSTKAYSDKTLTFTAEPNEGVQKREGSVTVKGGEFSETIKVYQTGEEPTLVISQNEYNLEAEGGSIVVEVSSNVAVTMTIPEDALWITENQTKSVSTSTFHLDIATNETTEARSAEITFSNEETGLCETITVYQAGEELTLVISQNEYELDAEGGSITVEVSSNVAVTMTIPEDALWITENQTKSVSTSTFYLDVAVNETKEARSAEITFSNEESGLSEKVTVNQEGNGSINVPEIVDLGLSVKWASFNVGASKPEEYGGYYQWAGIKDVSDTSIYLDWDNCPYHIGSDGETGWTKYVDSGYPSFWSGTGSPDNKPVLDPEDDVAHVIFGDKWRMPTHAEFDELCANCTWTWTQLNGVNGYKVTSNKSGYSDKWIFLPAAGWRVSNDLYNAGYQGNYWSSSPYCAFMAYFLVFNSYEVSNSYCISRFGGDTVRPVYDDLGDDKVRVTGVSVSPYDISLNVGETFTLSATVFPSNATNQTVTWVSNDYDIATVDDFSGKVTAVKEGITFIHARTSDGDYWSACEVTVRSSKPGVPEAIDLGLSVKWASFNVGASKPEEYGGYYQWAGLEDVTSTSIYLDWTNCPYHTGWDNETGWTKYIPINRSSYWLGSGSPDNKTVLDPEDDVAYKTLGDKWRMPTDDEWSELRDNCTWTWTYNYNGTGVAGRIVTSNISGYTDKSIFLPAAGCRSNDAFCDLDRDGSYWCSSLVKDPCYAYGLFFDFDYVGGNVTNRYDGRSVRPVYGDRTSESVNFPDEAFRNYMIQNYDLNNDGAVSLNEASKVEVIKIETTDIESLSGIEYCTELKVLECCGIPKNRAVYPAKLREVDVSKNLKLEYLNLNFNMLESLNVSNNANLRSLSCLESNLSTLDLSHCTRLETFDGDGIKTINISNTKLNDDCRIRGASKIVAKNCKSIQQLFFDVTTSNCTIDTDIPVATFTVYIDINTNINFGSSKVEILLVNGKSLGTGYHANLTIKSQNASRVIIDDAPHTLSLCDNDIDLVPKLEKLELYGLPYEVRYSKKDEKDLTIWVCPYQDFRDVYIAQSKLINFGPYVPVWWGYLWKYVKSTPIFVNTYTRSVTNTVYTTGAKETNWTPQQDGYEWYPVSGVDFYFPE